MYQLTKGKDEDMLEVLTLLLLVEGDVENLMPEEFIIAKDSTNNVLGCGRLKHYSDQCIELASIAVYPEHRKIGVASNIIQNLVESTKEKIY
ncbi:MAG: GNAT family N-acetyltransferase, partial [Nanoarchaeota archaeon]